jgi:hypothetical protein
MPVPFARFAATRGSDIRLDLIEDPPPEPDARQLLFDSGSVWRVHRRGRGLLYTFRTDAMDPPIYKAVEIDPRIRRGILFFPRPAAAGAPRSALDFPLDELLFQKRLALEGGTELHACGVLIGGKAVVFCGQSGAGKTTMARLWCRHRPEAAILSDDRIVLRRHPGGLRAFGTPWHGVGGFAAPDHGRLAAICFLRHASKTALRPLAPAKAAAQLFARGFPPLWDPRAVRSILATCAKAARTVPCYDFGFRPDRSAVEAVCGAIGD